MSARSGPVKRISPDSTSSMFTIGTTPPMTSGNCPISSLFNSSGLSGMSLAPKSTAAFENAQDIISVAFLMDPSDPQWSDDAGMKKFDEFLVKYFPEGNRADNFIVTGCNVAQ